ncbi:MAG: DNA polymerase III subunit delta' [Thiohalomonadaceae bacterium]
MSELPQPYPWQAAPWQALLRRADEGRLPHALLLAGPAGVGKRHLAEALAARLLCEDVHGQGACGKCRGCHLFLTGNHPDLLRVYLLEDKKDLTIAQVREAIAFQELKPQYARHKVIVVAPAERMNENAANALLKTLEEPAEGTLLILVSDRPGSLLPTIRSRCQLVQLGPATADADTMAWLAQQLPAGTDVALALALSGNAPLAAVQFITGGGADTRGAVLDGLEAVADGALPSEVAGSWGDDVEGAVHWAYVTVSELIRLKAAGAGVSQLNGRELRRLQDLAEPVDLVGLYRILDRLQEAPRALRGNANAQILLEEILVHWAALFARARNVARTR